MYIMWKGELEKELRVESEGETRKEKVMGKEES